MKKTLVGVAAAVLVLSACSGSGGDGPGSGAADGEPVVDGTLTYAINDDPGNLFRHLNSSTTLSAVYPWSYESLVHFDTDGIAQPWLAEEWEESPTSLSFTIREGVRCEDGTEFTAEVAANNFRWIVDPDNKSTMAGLVVPTDVEVEHDDQSRTVTLTTENPNSFLLASIGVHPLYCQAALDDPDSVASATNGTGLFQLSEAVPNDHYTFTRNDDYAWAPEGGNDASTPGVPKEVVVRIVDNPSTRANLLLSGEVNLAAVQGPDEERLAAQTDAVLTSQALTGAFAYSQADGQPTADEAVRVALTHALDLDSLMRVQTADKGGRAPGMAVLPPTICQYDAATTELPATDVAAAERMLDEAGWQKGADGVRVKDGEPLALTFVYHTRVPETESTAELMKQQWEAVGAQVRLDGSEFNAFSEKINAEGAAADFDVVWFPSNYTVPNVLAGFYSGPVPPDGSNAAAIENPDFDQLVAESSQYSGQEACAVWEKAESEMYASADYVPFAMNPDVYYAQGVRLTIAEDLMAPSVLLVES